MIVYPRAVAPGSRRTTGEHDVSKDVLQQDSAAMCRRFRRSTDTDGITTWLQRPPVFLRSVLPNM